MARLPDRAPHRLEDVIAVAQDLDPVSLRHGAERSQQAQRAQPRASEAPALAAREARSERGAGSGFEVERAPADDLAQESLGAGLPARGAIVRRSCPHS